MDTSRRIGPDGSVREEVAVQGAHRRERADDGGGPVRRAVVTNGARERRDEGGDGSLIRVLQSGNASRLEERGVACEIPPIGGDRVRSEAALDREMVEEPLDLPADAARHRYREGRRGSTGASGMPCASATPAFVTCPA